MLASKTLLRSDILQQLELKNKIQSKNFTDTKITSTTSQHLLLILGCSGDRI